MVSRWYFRLRDGLLRGLEIFVCITLLAIFGMVISEVILRTFFGMSITYFVELPRLLLIYITFLYIGIALKQNKHIKVGLIPESLNPVLKKVINIIVHLLMIYACYLLLQTSISLVKLHFTIKSATYTAVPIPMWLFSISCLFGLGLTLVLCVDTLIQDIIVWVMGSDQTDAKK